MNQRITLGIAAVITAFVLVLLGGLANQLGRATGQAAAAPQASALDPTVEALIQEREAAYQTALAEANRRLEEANRQIATANARLAGASAPAAPAAQPAPDYAISAEQAQRLALAAAPGGSLTKPAELVSYQGTPAYEIVLDNGTLYIDAQSGAVLANSATPAPEAAISPEQAAEAAVSYRGGGTVRKVERENERGRLVYEVKFVDGVEVYVDAQSGAVLADSAAPAPEAAISPEQAAEAAVSYRGGGTVREVEREDERGRLVYEVKFVDGAKVYVDAATGQVVYARVSGEGETHRHGN